ncbi:universal stress protein [Parapedobacter soli]|uniref:universal stress protein n=1 Tax=Parapedobacter soli TaxID=416955 RepID=UPI0021C7C836|nr:universal stress protein [Parapedobacter soli]
MKTTILVPTDFSSNALAATQYAIKLAKELALDIHILHAYMAFHSAFQSDLANQTDEKRATLGAQKGMQSFLQSFGQFADKPGISSSEVKADLVEAVRRYTADNDTRLIVMGTHGASGMKMGLLGSNTYDIAKTAVVPLLIIPASTAVTGLENVVFFTDYQDGDEETLKGLISLFGRSIRRCTLVHIHEGHTAPEAADHEKLDQWRTRLESASGFKGLAAEMVHGKESVEIVDETIDRLQATLTVLTLVGGRSFFEKLVHKSLAKAIIHQPKTPVLLIAGN